MWHLLVFLSVAPGVAGGKGGECGGVGGGLWLENTMQGRHCVRVRAAARCGGEGQGEGVYAHGAWSEPVVLEVRGDDEQVCLSVCCH